MEGAEEGPEGDRDQNLQIKAVDEPLHRLGG
jgi:hypothetical protein